MQLKARDRHRYAEPLGAREHPLSLIQSSKQERRPAIQ